MKEPRWIVKPDPMINGYWMLRDTSMDGTIGQRIDWHGVAYAQKPEAEAIAAALNEEETA